jgi:hypothetical protein
MNPIAIILMAASEVKKAVYIGSEKFTILLAQGRLFSSTLVYFYIPSMTELATMRKIIK